MSKAKPKNKDINAARVRILDAAAQLYREQGYAAVSTRAIAGAAGMKAGSLYYHFASKDQIVAEILKLGIMVVHDEVACELAKLPDNATAREMVGAGIRGHLRALLQYRDYTSANVRIFGQVPDEIQKSNMSARKKYEELWDGLLAKLQERGELRAQMNIASFRLLLIGALNATLEWFDPKKGEYLMLADNYTEVLLNGILKDGSNKT